VSILPEIWLTIHIRQSDKSDSGTIIVRRFCHFKPEFCKKDTNARRHEGAGLANQKGCEIWLNLKIESGFAEGH
jgi:hypothetical protein